MAVRKILLRKQNYHVCGGMGYYSKAKCKGAKASYCRKSSQVREGLRITAQTKDEQVRLCKIYAALFILLFAEGIDKSNRTRVCHPQLRMGDD